MDSSSSVGSYYKCDCGLPALVRLVQRNDKGNRGRRFAGCPNYKGDNKCDFFIWIDPPKYEKDGNADLAKVRETGNVLETERAELYKKIGKLEYKSEMDDGAKKELKKQLAAEVIKKKLHLSL